MWHRSSYDQPNRYSVPNALVTPDYRPNQVGSSPPQVQSGALRSGSEALSLWLLAYFPTEVFKLNPCAAVYL